MSVRRFRRFSSSHRKTDGWALFRVFCFATDAIVKGNKLIITAALPGLSARDVKVEINDDNSLLFITATRTYRHEEDGESDGGSVQYHAFESTHGTNQRTIGLPENAKVDTIKTGMKSGMLKIEMKLKPEEKLEEGPEEGRRVIDVEDC